MDIRPAVNKIFITKPSEEVETLPLPQMAGKASERRGLEEGPIFRSLFQRLYDDGWRIESVAGADSNYMVLYILTRELK